MVEFARQNLKEFVNYIETFVEDLDAFGNIEIVSGASVKRLEFGIVPKEFRSVEDLAVQINEVAFNENLSHLLGDFFARQRNFAFLGKVERKSFCMLDRLLDKLFKSGEFY